LLKIEYGLFVELNTGSNTLQMCTIKLTTQLASSTVIHIQNTCTICQIKYYIS